MEIILNFYDHIYMEIILHFYDHIYGIMSQLPIHNLTRLIESGSVLNGDCPFCVGNLTGSVYKQSKLKHTILVNNCRGSEVLDF